MLRAASSATDPEPAAPLRSVGKEMPDFGGARAAAVIHRGDLLGALVVRRKAGDPLTATEEKLLADLASQASLVIRNVRLVEDLRASRQRIVAAQDERAKALERNIHDGAQQQLVSLAIKLGLLERTIGADDERARAMAGELEAEASEALDELRDLARGIYPPLLADKGLATALEAQARKAAVSVELTTNGIGRYPPEVEAAVYFCCLEALNNVSKYARPVCGGRPAGDPRGGDIRSCRRRGRLRPDHDRLRHRPPGHGRPARSDRRTARSHERSRGGHDDHGSGGGGRKGPVMKERTANRLSLGLLWTTIAFGSGFVVDISLGTAVTFGGGNRGSGAITLLVGLAGAAGAAGVSLLGGLMVRRAHNPIGWAFQAMALAGVTAFGTDTLLQLTLGRTVPLHPPGITVVGWVNNISFLALVLPIPAIFLLFPTGRALSPRWRWGMRLWGVGVATTLLWAALRPGEVYGNLPPDQVRVDNPLAIDALRWLFPVLANIGGFAALAAAVLGVISLAVRFRRSHGEERAQMRWLAFAALIAGGLLLVQLAIVLVFGDGSPVSNRVGPYLYGGVGHRLARRHPGLRCDRDLEVPALRPRCRDSKDRGLRTPGSVHHRGLRRNRRRHRGDRGFEELDELVVRRGGGARRLVPAGARPGPTRGRPARLRPARDALRGPFRVLRPSR
jgi:hypothetical protein